MDRESRNVKWEAERDAIVVNGKTITRHDVYAAADQLGPVLDVLPMAKRRQLAYARLVEQAIYP